MSKENFAFATLGKEDETIEASQPSSIHRNGNTYLPLDRHSENDLSLLKKAYIELRSLPQACFNLSQPKKNDSINERNKLFIAFFAFFLFLSVMTYWIFVEARILRMQAKLKTIETNQRNLETQFRFQMRRWMDEESPMKHPQRRPLLRKPSAEELHPGQPIGHGGRGVKDGGDSGSKPPPPSSPPNSSSSLIIKEHDSAGNYIETLLSAITLGGVNIQDLVEEDDDGYEQGVDGDVSDYEEYARVTHDFRDDTESLGGKSTTEIERKTPNGTKAEDRSKILDKEKILERTKRHIDDTIETRPHDNRDRNNMDNNNNNNQRTKKRGGRRPSSQIRSGVETVRVPNKKMQLSLPLIHLEANSTTPRTKESESNAQVSFSFWNSPSWSTNLGKGIFHLDVSSGHVSVDEGGAYLVYVQVLYHDAIGRWSLGVVVNEQVKSKCLESEQLREVNDYHPTSHGVYKQCSITTIIHLHPKQSVSIKCMYGQRTILTQPEFTFWGMIKLA